MVSSVLPASQISAFQASKTHYNVDLKVPVFGRPTLSRLNALPSKILTSISDAAEKPLAQVLVNPSSTAITSEKVTSDANLLVNLKNSDSRKGYEPVSSARGAPKDVMATYNPRTPKQEVGSCHMFAVAQVLYSTIKRITGREISIGTMFADHLVSPANIGPAGFTQDIQSHVLNTHLRHLEHLKSEGGNCDHAAFEGGNFFLDMILLEKFGAALVTDSKDMKFVENAAKGVHAAKQELFKDSPHPDALPVIEQAITDILSKSVHAGKDKVDRATVRQIVKALKFQRLNFELYNRLPLKEALNTAKNDLIGLLQHSGVAYLSVDAEQFYRKKGQKASIAHTIFPTTSNHAIALVGYQVKGDMFLIKDSNQDGVVKISAPKLLVALRQAFGLWK